MENITTKPASPALSEPRASFSEIARVYGSVGSFVRANLTLLWIGLALLLWFLNPIKALPTPMEALAAFRGMWRAPGSQGLVYNVYVTLKLNVVGLLYSSLISLVISYLSV